MTTHPAFHWLLHALAAGVNLFPLSPGQKRPIPPRPLISILVDDGSMGIAPTGPNGFAQDTLKTLLRGASTSALTTGGPNPSVYATAVTMALQSYDVLLGETTPEFEPAWIAFLNSRATLLPTVLVSLPEV